MSATDAGQPEDSESIHPLPSLTPDFIEEQFPDQIDNIVPTRGYQMTPMVGLGGSAGSIQPLINFFKAMAVDSGMSFVVILHLSPKHESTMSELLANSTSMAVEQAFDGQKVQPNHVYVIPPRKYLAAVDGTLKLTEMEKDSRKRVAVDIFFRSLADTYGPSAAAVILSGADGDGALGIKRIKERGGLTIAQDPDQAEHSSMPQAAIDTGMVDWVLRMEQIPHKLLEYRKNAMKLKLPPEDGPPPLPQLKPPADDAEAALRDVLVFLRMRSGRDFSYYKRATILRRIARRMQVNGVEDMPGYLSFLRTHPGESSALLQDLLISVTNFFRDRHAFEALEHYIPGLFFNKSPGDLVRVWSPACATGEEAYSLAILLLEQACQIDSPPVLQVFACDLDEQAIQVARAGKYPETITADVSEDRLRRFFVKEVGGYRVRRELREMVLFATHDLLKDAPFSRMDMISCRNLLIYLGQSAQQRALEIFHFALKPGGILFLGSSESIDENSPLFRALDKKHRIYAHQAAAKPGLPISVDPSSLVRAIHANEQLPPAPVVHGSHFVPDARVLFQTKLETALDRTALAELHLKLIERLGPPSVIVNADHDIVHLSEHVAPYLKFTGGEPTTNLLRLVLPELRIELRMALFRAGETHATAESPNVPVDIDGQLSLVQVGVAPAPDIGNGFLLVTFDRREADPALANREGAQPATPEPAVRQLERELTNVKGTLRDTVEQYEASTEELKASNEELQAMNEELRSATEELETSREELQSINEELSTVNLEMKAKMDELASANSDLQNLMAATGIATVFLDRELAVTRYTPTAVHVFNLIPGDLGRPLAHLNHRLDYPELIADAQTVLRTLVPMEREVRDDGRWYIARIQPYRTIEDHIAGIVMTLVDVSDRNRATEALRQSEERLRLVIESTKDYAIFTMSLERRVDSWNKGAETMFGYSDKEIIGQDADVLFTPEDRARGEPERELRLAREQGRAQNERWHARKDGSIFYGAGSMMVLRDRSGGLRGFVKIMRDLTDEKRTQEALRQHIDELTRFNSAAVGRETRMIDLKKEVNDLCVELGKKPRYSLTMED